MFLQRMEDSIRPHKLFYTGYSYNLSFLQLDANIRYENVSYTYKDANNTHKVFNDFFPSLSLSTSFNEV